MADSLAFEPIRIASHRGPYEVRFERGTPFASAVPDRPAHLVLDACVADLYRQELAGVVAGRTVLRIEADETAKSLDRCQEYVERLVAGGIRRSDLLLAIGGGVVQDIACFLAAVLLRGVDWRFYPTTLLAQADSCIGSKSSINVGPIKNIVGTFTPPQRVVVNPNVLRTLDGVEIRSGIGEMLKVHAIDSPAAFDRIATDYGRLGSDDDVLVSYIDASLRIKQRLIEADEFDVGVRRVMNYGHSFGHAIESATDFAIPHGIAVTLGMDMANWVAAGLGVATRASFDRMHPTLMRNAGDFTAWPIPVDRVVAAIAKDKKNTASALTLVLPDAQGIIGLRSCANDARFRELCASYLAERRAA